MGLGKEIYNDTAEFGRVWALISAIIATVIGIALIAGGIYILVKKDSTGSSGTVIKVDGNEYGRCQQVDSNNGVNNYSCILTVRYIENGVETTENISYYGSTLYMVGSTIKIRDHAIIDKGPPRWAGGLMILMAILIAGAGWFWYWASRRYKTVAAAEGLGGMLNIIRS